MATIKYDNGEYVGEVKNGKFHGKGVYYWVDESRVKEVYENGNLIESK